MMRVLGTALLALTLVTASSLPAQAPPRVTGLRLAPSAAGETELIVETSAPVEGWEDFSMASPPRLVVDLAGARTALQNRFDGIRRGGVQGIRTSQFSANVVRVVVDLDRVTPYTITRASDGLHIRFAGAAGTFAAWNSAAAPPSTAPAVAPRAAAPQQPCITASFIETDILDVLASFAEFASRSIVPGAGVKGTVNASIRCQPWDIALESILSAQGLAAQELPSGIIQVDSLGALQRRETQEALVTQTFRINYVPVAEIVSSLEPLKTERGRISSNVSTNMLIVTDTRSVVDDLAQMVQRLDVRTPQVSIEAKIIFVNRTRADELGLTYDLKDSRGNSLNRLTAVPDPLNPGELTSDNLVLLGGNSIAALGNASVRVQSSQLETVMSLVLGRYTLVTFLDALQSIQLSDVQAAPVITALDNQEAEIMVGERTPIRVVDLGSTGTGGGAAGGGTTVNAPRASAELVETGIILRVTPHVTDDRHILMQIHAERSNAQLVATEIGVNFQRQAGTTRLMVADGETAVIGGLTVTEVQNTTSGIPFLMDIPFVGRLFRTERKQEQKRDLLIMVTPHIIGEHAAVPLAE
jgi:type IV pilus assembly protein PilQ